MTSAFSFMDLIILGGGIYILYGWYLLVFKNEIKPGLLIPQNLSPKACLDPEGFKKYMGPRTLIFGLSAVASGAIGLFQDFAGSVPPAVYWVFFVLFLAVVIWYMIATKKAQKMFFNVK